MGEKLNVLLLGGGGREHALAQALARSPRLKRLFILPGNGGTGACGTNVPGDPCDARLALDVARREQIDLTVVGPEDPLAGGIVDAFTRAGFRIFGPTAAAARLEADKAWAKTLLRQHSVPMAEGRVFSDFGAAREFISTRDEAVVVKAAGLAKGKGVLICEDPSDAILAAERVLVNRIFGDAGAKIVVEERLRGREVSLMSVVDGHTLYVLSAARDYKRLRDGDEGPNTGGMGSYSPPEDFTPELLERVEREILVPTVDALVRSDIAFRGVLYAGLMLTPGGPKLLEFNCRFGDPETQALLPRLRSDLLDLLDAATTGRLEQADVKWDPRPAVCTVLAARGYPDKPESGARITGLDAAERLEDCFVFHAGTRVADGNVITSGGRVLGVSALGDTLEDAADRSLRAAEQIHFDGAVYRRDIARGAGLRR